MRIPLRLLILGLAVLSGGAAGAAGTLESASAAGGEGFLQAAGAFSFTAGAACDLRGAPAQDPQPGVDAPAKVHVPNKEVKARGRQTPIKEIDMAGLLNRHLKGDLTNVLGGKNVWMSGVFDREQAAYVSVLEEGKPARFYNVEKLLNKAEELPIGLARFRLSLSPDLSDNLESEIVLTNLADRKNKWRVTLREMLDAVGAAGEPVKAHGLDYRAFYYNDVKDGAANPQSWSFAFILKETVKLEDGTEKNEIHVFLIPAEYVPEDQIAVFKMHQNKPVGLQKSKGKLLVFENP